MTLGPVNPPAAVFPGLYLLLTAQTIDTRKRNLSSDSSVEKIRNGYLDSPHVKIASVTRHDVQVPILPVIPIAPVQQIRPFDIDGQFPLAKVAHHSHCEVVVGELVSGERITRTGIGKVCV